VTLGLPSAVECRERFVDALAAARAGDAASLERVDFSPTTSQFSAGNPSRVEGLVKRKTVARLPSDPSFR
jgi:hypothetical protein